MNDECEDKWETNKPKQIRLILFAHVMFKYMARTLSPQDSRFMTRQHTFKRKEKQVYFSHYRVNEWVKYTTEATLLGGEIKCHFI